MEENEKDLKDMSIKDDLYLSPFEKYTLYGLFPWNFLLSIILVFLTTAQVLFFINVNANYSYQQLLLWNKVFLNRDVEGSDTQMVNIFYIYHYSKLEEHVKETVNRYFDINSNTLDNYKYYYESDGTKKPVRMYVNFIDTNKATDKNFDTEYRLTPEYLGPLINDKDKEFIDLVDTFILEFKLVHDVNSNFPTSSNCFVWHIGLRYKYTLHGPIKVTLDTERTDCGSNKEEFFAKPFFFLHLTVAITAICMIYRLSIEIYRRINIVNNVNTRATLSLSWESLPISDKFKFFSVWGVIDLAGCIFQIFGAISCMFNSNISLDVQEKTVGLACFFAWIEIVKYLKPVNNAYTVANTIKRSYKVLGPYIIGILPIFLAFAFFAMSILWGTGNYNSLAYSMLLQFAMINGDSLFSSMTSAVSANNLFGLIYSFSFLLFFICVIHNIFIAIISESYESLKVRPIKEGYEDEEDFNNQGSLLNQQEIAPMILDQDKKKSKKKAENNKNHRYFQKLLAVKIKEDTQKDPKTMNVIKKANKIMKKIRKNIEKIGIILEDDKIVNADKDTLRNRAEDLLLTELDDYIEAALSPPSP